MIDIHSHILPGVDDGASSMKESLHMLSMARRQGITDVFATSHYSKAFPNRDPEKLRRLRDELMSRASAGIVLRYSGTSSTCGLTRKVCYWSQH